MKKSKFYLCYLVLFALLVSCSSQNKNLYEENTSSSLSLQKEETIYYVYQEGEYIQKKLDIEPISIDEETYKKRVFSEVVYPLQARESGIQGIVLITVTLDELGNLVNSKIKKGIGSGCDEEALKAVNRGFELGFEPAFINGRTVKVKYDIPMSFRLE